MAKSMRPRRYFLWITTFSGMWWDGLARKWVPSEEIEGLDGRHSLCVGCRTWKAFKRHLRKHPEIRGKAVLVGRHREIGE